MQQRIHTFWFLAAGVITTLIPVFFNGYPFVFSDTGTYISSGFENSVPGDRPITYGLFVRHISLANSLWLVVIAQAIIVNTLIWYFIKLITGAVNNSLNFTYLLAVLLLTAITAMPWFSGLIMPDIFTPISFLLLAILLLEPTFDKKKLLWLIPVYIYISTTHLSNLLSQVLLVLLVMLLKFVFKNILTAITFNRLRWVLVLVTLNFLAISAIHWAFGAPFKPSRHSHVFLTGKMVENGILKEYLEENCERKNYKLCYYKDSLLQTCPQFVWEPVSPLYKLGGWDANEQEYKAILKDIFTTPKWVVRFIRESLSATFKQATLNQFGEEFIPYTENTPPYMAMHWRYNSELHMYMSSNQNMWGGYNRQDFVTRSNRSNTWLLISLAGLLLILFTRVASQKFGSAIIITFIFFITNAAATASISTFAARYTSRFSWMFMLLFIVAILHYRKQIIKFILKQVYDKNQY